MRRFLWLSLGFLWLAGCAGQREVVSFPVQFEAKVPEELRQRLVAYWDARGRQDWKRALEFERPSWRRLYRPKRYQIYLSIVNKAHLLRLTVKNIRCKEKRCCFDLEGVFETPRGKENWQWGDCWVKEEGRWYHVVQDPLFFPPPRGKER